MKKKIIVLFILIAQITTVTAQNFKFGKVSKEELEEEFYPLDSTADAAYLYKYRRTYFDYNKNKGFMLVTEIHERIKIYTKEGFDKATKSIVYYKPDSGENVSVSSIKGYTFNLSDKGKVEDDKLSKSAIFDEKLSKYRSIKKITFPNVKEGSVLDIEYRIESPYTRNIDDVNYQFEIPVKHFETSIETPEYYTFSSKEKGYYFLPVKKISENKSFTFSNRNRSVLASNNGGVVNKSDVEYSTLDMKFNIDLYEAENIPALKGGEPFVTDIKNYRGGTEYELQSTKFPDSNLEFYSNSWENVSKQIYESSEFGGEIEKNNYYKNDLQNVIADTNNDFEKVGAIFQFVKRKVKWNNYNGIYVEGGVVKAYKEGSGNVAEINLMLTSMLSSVGLNAYPVLVSTRSNGIPFFPTIEGFNYVICMVKFPDNKYVLLDATEPYSTLNILPERVLNWNGRVVAKNGNSSWVKLTTSDHASDESMIIAKITEDLKLEGFIRTKFDNFSALNFRVNNNHLKNEALISKYEENNNIEIEDFKIENELDLNVPITRSVKFSSEDLVETINDKVYIEPLLFLTQHTNPFKLEDRKFPVDFATAWKDVSRISLEIPAGYKIESLPEPLAIGLPDNIGVFKYQVQELGNKIKTVSVLEFNSPMVPPQYYAFLKDFYSKLVAKQSEKIVLVKI